MTLFIVALYFALVLLIGALSHRLFRGTGEDYFLATRNIGSFILLMSLFGTHMTAFALLGASGEAYQRGIGVFALMASSSAIVVPALFFFLGVRMWWVAKVNGYMTQIQFFRQRWESEGLGLAIFVVVAALLIPYLLIGVMGGGIILTEITEGDVPEWVGGLAVCLVVMVYVTYGGMRGTAWVNTFETILFMTLGAVTFVVVVRKVGGLETGLSRVAEGWPELLSTGPAISPLTLLTYTLIPLSVGMFPHIFMHWLTAKSASTFRAAIVFYPLCVAVVWFPTVLLGVLARPEFPDLAAPQANSVLLLMIRAHAPEILAGLLAAGVFAAIMSSLDSQSLAIGTMFTQDIVRHFGYHDRMSERGQVAAGRLFVAAVLAVVFVLAQLTSRSIFALGVWSFTGYAALLPLLVAALYWKRSTRVGAWSALLTTALLWLYFFYQGWGQPQYTVADTGILPIGLMLPASIAALIVGSLLSTPPAPKTLAKFFPRV